MYRCLVLASLAAMATAQNAPAPNPPDAHILSPVAAISPVRAPVPSTGKLAGLPDLLPKLQGKPTLIGGEIFRLDSVRDEMDVQVFGGRKLRVFFDTRTQIFCDGAPASVADLRAGAHVYLETVTAGKEIFAGTIRIVSSHVGGQTTGQLVGYDPGKGKLLMNDALSPHEFAVHLSPATVIERSGNATPAATLKDGSLISVEFVADKTGSPLARRISILAEPGHSYVFFGQVTFLDLGRGTLALLDTRTQKSYDIVFNPGIAGADRRLTEGSNAEVKTTFDGGRYVATAIRATLAQDGP